MPLQSWSVLLRQLLRPEASCGGAGEPPCTSNRCEAVTVRLAHAVTSSTSGRNLAEWETAETTCMLEPYKSTSLSPIDTSNGDVLLLWVLLDLLRRLWSLCTAEPVIVRRVERSSGRAAQAPGTSFVVLRLALAVFPAICRCIQCIQCIRGAVYTRERLACCSMHSMHSCRKFPANTDAWCCESGTPRGS